MMEKLLALGVICQVIAIIHAQSNIDLIRGRDICQGSSGCSTKCSGTDCHYCTGNTCCSSLQCNECVNKCNSQCSDSTCSRGCVNSCADNRSIIGRPICNDGGSCSSTRCNGNDCHYCSSSSNTCCQSQQCNQCVNNCNSGCNGQSCSNNCVQSCARQQHRGCRKCDNSCTTRQCYRDCSRSQDCASRDDTSRIIILQGDGNDGSNHNAGGAGTSSGSASRSDSDVNILTTLDITNNIDNINKVEIPIDVESVNTNNIQMRTTGGGSRLTKMKVDKCRNQCAQPCNPEPEKEVVCPDVNVDCKAYCDSQANATDTIIPKPYPVYQTYPVPVERIVQRPYPVHVPVPRDVPVHVPQPVYIPQNRIRTIQVDRPQYVQVPYRIPQPYPVVQPCPQTTGCATGGCSGGCGSNQGYVQNGGFSQNCDACFGCSGRPHMLNCFRANGCSPYCINLVSSFSWNGYQRG